MAHTCPSCGATKFRLSKARGVWERFLQVFGYNPFRCVNCEERFKLRIWSFDHLLYAKCPRCHRMDLSRWSTTRYNASTGTNLRIAMGAKPVRCEYCRCNFASWKAVKERFSYTKRAERSQILIPVGDPKNLGVVNGAPKAAETIIVK